MHLQNLQRYLKPRKASKSCILDANSGLAKISPMTVPRAERLPSSNSEEECNEEQQPTPSCILPAVLRDRPHSSRGGRGVPPPVPPRSPRRPHDSRDASLSRGEFLDWHTSLDVMLGACT